MPPRLDRLVTLRVAAGTAPADGGLGSAVAGFRIVHERAGVVLPGDLIDTYLVAVGSDGNPAVGTIAGRWLAGSTLVWTPDLFIQQTATVARTIEWTAATYSLRYGAAHVNARDSVADTVTPPITNPGWESIIATYGTYDGAANPPTLTGGAPLNIEGVLVSTERDEFRAWAMKLEQFSRQSEVTEGTGVAAKTFTRITSVSTWRLRNDPRVRPYSILTDGDDVWQVVGRQHLRSTATFMDLECQLALER